MKEDLEKVNDLLSLIKDKLRVREKKELSNDGVLTQELKAYEDCLVLDQDKL